MMSGFCSNCGAKLNAASAFCPNCGAKTDGGGTAAQTGGAPPKKKRKLGPVLGIVGGVAAAGIAVLVLFLTGVLGGAGDISAIEGTWYGEGKEISFYNDGTAKIVAGEKAESARFSYDAGKAAGVIYAPEEGLEDVAFALNDGVLNVKGAAYYRDKADVPGAQDAAPEPEETPAPTPEATPEPTEAQDMPVQIDEKILGIWQVATYVYEGEPETVQAGEALEFLVDGTLQYYTGYQEFGQWQWYLNDDGQIQVDGNDDSIEWEVSFQPVNGQDGVVLDGVYMLGGETETYELIAVDKTAFLAQGSDIPKPDGLQEILGRWYAMADPRVTILFNADNTCVMGEGDEMATGTYTYNAGAGGGEIYTDDTGEVLVMELNIDTLTIEGIVFVRGSGEQNALLPQMQGFWQVCGATEYPPVNDYALGLGKGIEFWGEQMDFYDAYLVDTLDIDFEFTDSGQMHYIEDGDEYFVNVYFETVAGEEMLVMTSDSGTIYLMRSTYQEFMGEERDNRVAGMWYDETGFGGTVQFFKDDRISITMIGVPFTGTYSFEEDSGTGQITIDEMSGVEMDEESAPFILDDGTLEIDGSFYTREYVPQMDY